MKRHDEALEELAKVVDKYDITFNAGFCIPISIDSAGYQIFDGGTDIITAQSLREAKQS